MTPVSEPRAPCWDVLATWGINRQTGNHTFSALQVNKIHKALHTASWCFRFDFTRAQAPTLFLKMMAHGGAGLHTQVQILGASLSLFQREIRFLQEMQTAGQEAHPQMLTSCGPHCSHPSLRGVTGTPHTDTALAGGRAQRTPKRSSHCTMTMRSTAGNKISQ